MKTLDEYIKFYSKELERYDPLMMKMIYEVLCWNTVKKLGFKIAYEIWLEKNNTNE